MLGMLYADGAFLCWTLEDVFREIAPDGSGKIAGKTAIPFGEYEVAVDRSARFNRLLPRLLNVPHFEGVRIHAGNTAADTEGCILVGLDKGVDCLSRSQLALQELMDKLAAGLQEGPVRIGISRYKAAGGGE